MDVEFIWNYCLSKNGVEETFPFNPSTLVFKIGGRIFALFDIDNFTGINLKCDPERSINLRESHSGIIPAFHMNKKHWNTVSCDGSIPDKLILEWTNDSYNLVLNSLPIRVRKELLG